MEKKQAQTAVKSPAKAKLKLNKVTVRDLDTRKADQIKGGPQSSRQRCY
ncbi:MAG: hypothetical protein IPP07_00270 [Holophagales bacterium]|nr:hypothetical protein [Holophagales bacterium]MBK9963398.1 hypothetical protein [Holophagales bacterium]